MNIQKANPVRKPLQVTLRVFRSPLLWRLFYEGDRHGLVDALQEALIMSPVYASWYQALNEICALVDAGADKKQIEKARLHLHQLLIRA